MVCGALASIMWQARHTRNTSSPRSGEARASRSSIETSPAAAQALPDHASATEKTAPTPRSKPTTITRSQMPRALQISEHLAITGRS